MESHGDYYKTEQILLIFNKLWMWIFKNILIQLKVEFFSSPIVDQIFVAHVSNETAHEMRKSVLRDLFVFRSWLIFLSDLAQILYYAFNKGLLVNRNFLNLSQIGQPFTTNKIWTIEPTTKYEKVLLTLGLTELRISSDI